jgi:hypothetical protein
VIEVYTDSVLISTSRWSLTMSAFTATSTPPKPSLRSLLYIL